MVFAATAPIAFDGRLSQHRLDLVAHLKIRRIGRQQNALPARLALKAHHISSPPSLINMVLISGLRSASCSKTIAMFSTQPKVGDCPQGNLHIQPVSFRMHSNPELLRLIHDNLWTVISYAFGRPKIEKVMAANIEGSWPPLEKNVRETAEVRADRALLEMATQLRAADHVYKIDEYQKDAVAPVVHWASDTGRRNGRAPMVPRLHKQSAARCELSVGPSR